MPREVPCYPVSVKALIEEKGRFFFILKKRGNRTFYGLPGGLKEPGETLEEALKREVKEETNWDIEVIDILGAGNFYHWTGSENVVVYYLARVVGGELYLRGEEDVEFVGHRWLAPDEFDVLWPEGYRRALLDMLKRALRIGD